ncbi:hypothetical protein [Myxococcus sp. RHSTA-1-4]|uniref:hypothetical protein n=1 Tax=Myxococcus sp. RHSTA-1-4 TaxID=2874601 RepID=UPI001CBC1DC3|nr:hypothetical protein [Myxococcus sp. RHSTA-1-4]MBZ4422653.1 hypothetical protein [Myxococcus sp. RHSTA-1-4]
MRRLLETLLGVGALGGFVVLVAVFPPTPSVTVQVDSELVVRGGVDETCLARHFADASVRGWYVMPVDDVFGPDRNFGGEIGIQVAGSDRQTTTLRVVSEARANARSLSPEEWRNAEKNNALAIERILSQCVPAENVVSRSCIRRGHPSSAVCGAGV